LPVYGRHSAAHRSSGVLLVTFRAKLVILLIVLLLPLIASEGFFHYRQYVRDQERVLTEQEQSASEFAGATDVFVARTVAIERALGQALVTLSWPSSKAKLLYLSSALDSIHTVRWIAFADTSGKIVYSTSSAVTGVSIADRNYFKLLRSGQTWRVSDVLVAKGENQVGFIIGTAIRDERGRFQGAVTAAVNEHQLLSALRTEQSSNIELVLVDSLGRVGFLSDKPGELFPLRDWSTYPFVVGALHGRTEYVTSFSRAGRPEMMGAMLPIPTLGWAAGSFVPKRAALQTVRRAAFRALYVTLAVLAFTLVLGSILATQMIKPVESLSDAAEEFGHGDLTIRAEVPTTQEFGMLAVTMNHMAEQIQQRDQELNEAFQREKRISATLQKAMLPDVPERVGGILIATGYFPALKEAEIGGDFFDVICLPDGKLGLVIADVSGKGLSAAVRTAMARYMIEGFAYQRQDPTQVLSSVNAAVCGLGKVWNFITVFLGIIDDSGKLLYANAGHPPPIVRRKDGSIEKLDRAAGFPLGVDENADYSIAEVALGEGDTAVCYTDGITEARQSTDWFGEERLTSLLAITSGNPKEVVNAVYSAVSEFTGGRPSDDIALLVVKRKHSEWLHPDE